MGSSSLCWSNNSLEDNSLLTIIAPSYSSCMINEYAQPWGIETLFGIFKTRGFNLEDTHNVLIRTELSSMSWSKRI